jgi:hypothetical protein
MSIDIFDKIPIRWRWAFVTFRLHILHRGKTYYYLFFGVLWLYMLFERFHFLQAHRKSFVFWPQRIFMMHLLYCLIWIYGHPLENLVRPKERVRPPWKGNLNAGPVTVQAMSYGTFAEIYRDRVFRRFFDAMRWILGWAVGLFSELHFLCAAEKSRTAGQKGKE